MDHSSAVDESTCGLTLVLFCFWLVYGSQQAGLEQPLIISKIVGLNDAQPLVEDLP